MTSLEPTNDQGAPRAASLWRDDTGELSLDARRALVQLLKGPVLDGTRMPVIWRALEATEREIRSRLHDLFLDLIIDRDQMIAFTRQADTGIVKAPILLKRKPLTYIETYLFLLLRQRLSAAEGRGERAGIYLNEIREYVSVIGGATTDRVGFEKHLTQAVKKAERFGVLRHLRNAEESYEISPVLKMIMTADVVEEVKAYYEGKVTTPVTVTQPGVTSEGQPNDEADGERQYDDVDLNDDDDEDEDDEA